MKKHITIGILITALASCDVKQSKEYKELESKNIALQKEIDSLRSTPDRIYYTGMSYFKSEDFSKAVDEFNKIKKLYEGSEFFDKANLKLKEITRIVTKKKEEEELRLRLKFKVLKEKPTFKTEDLTVRTFGHNFTRQFDHDRYGREYRYREAKRGYRFLSFDTKISSDINQPKLPAFYVYALEGGVLKRISSISGMDYEFYDWEDYGAYLGNYTDYKNDFQRTKTVRFDIAEEFKISQYKGKEIYLVATKVGRVSRREKSYNNPPVSYKISSAYEPPSEISTVSNFESEFILVKKFKL